MNKFIILFAIMTIALIGSAQATSTVIAAGATKTLDSKNDYTLAPATWTTLATSTSQNYIAVNEKYDYIIGVNVTVVGTSPKFNVLAGTNPPAFRAGIGDLAYDLSNGTVQWFGPLETARFLNSTGYFTFSTTNVTTGKIMCLKIAKVAT